MKKLTLFLVVVLSAVILFGCNESTGSNVGYTDAKGNTWVTGEVDKDLVGYWQIVGNENSEIYLFTEDCKIKVVRGTVSFESDVEFGKDADGNNMYKSNFYYMYGELTYTVDGDTATFVDSAGTTQVFNKCDFIEPELKVYDDFNADNPLVGTWHNEEFKDTYVFKEDGTATYTCEMTDYSCLAYSYYTYKADDKSVTLSFDAGQGTDETVSTYVINGDTLILNGEAEYTRK